VSSPFRDASGKPAVALTIPISLLLDRCQLKNSLIGVISIRDISAAYDEEATTAARSVSA